MWLEKLARFGCATKGLVYFTIGLLALRLAFGISSQTTNSKGALKFISAQPFGKFALVIVAIGLSCYTLWRLFEAINPYSFQFTRSQIIERLSFLFSGLSYGGLAFCATKIILNLGVDYSDKVTDWTAILMSQPFGQLFVGIAGLIIVGVGSFFFYRAFSEKASHKLNFTSQEAKKYTWAIAIGKFGITARGFIFILIGFFLIQSARQFDPETAVGLDQVLELIAIQPQGKFLLSLVALGFIAYSLHMCIEAKYRDFSQLRQKVKNTLPLKKI